MMERNGRANKLPDNTLLRVRGRRINRRRTDDPYLKEKFLDRAKADSRKARIQRKIREQSKDESLSCRLRNSETLGLDIDLFLEEHDRLDSLKKKGGSKGIRDKLDEYQLARNKIEKAYLEDVSYCADDLLVQILIKHDEVFQNRNLGKMASQRFYDANVMKTLECVFGALQWDGSPEVQTLPWTMRFRNLAGSLDDVRDESANGIVFFTELSGSELPLALKTTRDLTDQDGEIGIVHEAFVGIYAINYLREFIPSFVYTYGTFQGSPPLFNYEQDDVSYLRRDQDSMRSTYLITEDLRPAVGFGRFIRKHCRKPHEILEILLQILYALAMANHFFGFTHNDLHLGNILIKDVRDEIRHVCLSKGCTKVETVEEDGEIKYSIPFVTERGLEYLRTRWLAVIIDIGDSYIHFDPEVNNWRKFDIPDGLRRRTKAFRGNFGSTSNFNKGAHYDRSYPLQDIHMLIIRTYDKILDSKCSAPYFHPLFDYFYPTAENDKDRLNIMNLSDEILFGAPEYDPRLGKVTYLQMASKIRCLFDLGDTLSPSSMGMTLSSMLNTSHHAEISQLTKIMICDRTYETQIDLGDEECEAAKLIVQGSDPKRNKEGALLDYLTLDEARNQAGITGKSRITDLISLADVINVLIYRGKKDELPSKEVEGAIDEVVKANDVERLWKRFATRLTKMLLVLKQHLADLDTLKPVKVAGRSFRNVYSKDFLKRYMAYTSRLGQITDLFLRIGEQLQRVSPIIIQHASSVVGDLQDGSMGFREMANRFLKVVEEDSGRFIALATDYAADFADLKRMMNNRYDDIADLIEEGDRPHVEYIWYFNGPVSLISLFSTMFQEQRGILDDNDVTPSKLFSERLKKAITVTKKMAH